MKVQEEYYIIEIQIFNLLEDVVFTSSFIFESSCQHLHFTF
jgi:hypothetical protein